MSTPLMHLTRGQLRAAADAGAIAVIPIGAVEQHGDHLPVGTDTLLVSAVVDRALASLDVHEHEAGGTASTWLPLPTLPFGHSPHHLFSAAVSLAPSTLSALLSDVLESLTATGFRRMIIVNGRGGNDEIMRLAVKAHALHADVSVGACSYWTLTGDTTGRAHTVERPENTPGHAGWFETSLMLAVHGALVQSDRPYQAAAPPALFENSPVPTLTLERHGEWARVGGITDDPADASAESGAQLLERRIIGLARTLAAFDAATCESHGPLSRPADLETRN